ncbi:Fe-Mn family superoxide dismutase [Paenibacillus sp. JGP012]|uniref:Fe-Mn family superoxide dismutase n=1 Tax=Paenibacillus sp. JGP012 TaxID=2735914 RepID=UPI0016087EFE|nr:Fe-Mn family superoxide dismutase [Paenibacillus sp. JGP012]MBB6023654.1 Fe-Mn family superoxide dismutase [Paenibacillus sp. JGP012]
MNCDEYGRLLPLRTLEEIRFWKGQEKEHTLLIRALVPDLEPAYVKLLEEWEAAFASSERAANQLIKQLLPATHPPAPYIMRCIDQLVSAAQDQSRAFIKQLYVMLEQSAAVRALPLAQTVILHIIRESEYFLGVLETLSQPGILREAPSSSTLLENALHSTRSDDNKEVWREAKETQSSSTIQKNAAPTSTVQTQSASPQPSAGGSASTEPLTSASTVKEKPVPIGGHTLPPLPYAYNALEPHIDELTMRIHHDKHHQSYVDGLNTAEKKLAESRKKNNFELVKHWERELAFNGAGHYLHTIFWTIMNPAGGGKPEGMLAEQIKRDFGSYEAFKNQFTEAANKVEGSGWAMLVWSPRAHRLEILQAEKHQNLSQSDIVPLLPLDVWEHAYYLKHQNERKKYIEDWWNVVYWPAVAERYEAARKLLWPPY